MQINKKQSTKCPILDACGVSPSDKNAGEEICLDCPRYKVGLECIIVERDGYGGKKE